MRNLILMMVLAVLMTIPAMGDYLAIHDGGVHVIADDRYKDDHIRLDYEVSNSPGTSLDLLENGIIGGELATFNTSTAMINGGTIGERIYASGNSKVEINSGFVLDYVHSGIDSVVEINGGEIGGNLHARERGIIHIKGGAFDGFMDAFHGGTIFLYGTNFMINDQSLNFGDNLRDFGVIGGQSNDYLTGIITGSLDNGTVIDNEFRISKFSDGSDIIIVPEPATLSLLLVGFSVVLRKRVK